MDFETYLRSKKINPAAFQEAEPLLWHEFKLIFDQVHPDSFTAQKLFLINSIRRRYTWQEEPEGKAEEKTVKPKPITSGAASESEKAKPKIAPKIKMTPKIKKKE